MPATAPPRPLPAPAAVRQPLPRGKGPVTPHPSKLRLLVRAQGPQAGPAPTCWGRRGPAPQYLLGVRLAALAVGRGAVRADHLGLPLLTRVRRHLRAGGSVSGRRSPSPAPTHRAPAECGSTAGGEGGRGGAAARSPASRPPLQPEVAVQEQTRHTLERPPGQPAVEGGSAPYCPAPTRSPLGSVTARAAIARVWARPLQRGVLAPGTDTRPRAPAAPRSAGGGPVSCLPSPPCPPKGVGLLGSPWLRLRPQGLSLPVCEMGLMPPSTATMRLCSPQHARE